jgi:septum formation protein
MLFSLIENLEKVDIILASASPRRFELLKTIGLEFKVVVSKVNEDSVDPNNLIDGVTTNARRKGLDVATLHPNQLVICADTVVVTDSVILGKPRDENEAFRMLQALSGKTHRVITAFGLIFQKYEKSLFDYETTEVTFRTLNEDEIWAYINTGEPMDKAGAYASQGQGAVLIEKIQGCYFNVVGFPLTKFYLRINDFFQDFVL